MRFVLFLLFCLSILTYSQEYNSNDCECYRSYLSIGVSYDKIKKYSGIGLPYGFMVNHSKELWQIHINIAQFISTTKIINSDPQFQWDYFDNGQKRCRDKISGWFAYDSDCNPSEQSLFLYTPSLDVIYKFDESTFGGGGIRIHNGIIPYISTGILSTINTFRL